VFTLSQAHTDLLTSATHIDLTYYTLTRHRYYF